MDPFFTGKLRNYIHVCTSGSSETPPAASTPEKASTKVKQSTRVLDVSGTRKSEPAQAGITYKKSQRSGGLNSAAVCVEEAQARCLWNWLAQESGGGKSALSQYNVSDLELKMSKSKGKEPANVTVAGLDQATNDTNLEVPEPETDKDVGKKPTNLIDIEEEHPVVWLGKRIEVLKVSNASFNTTSNSNSHGHQEPTSELSKGLETHKMSKASSAGSENHDSAAPIPKNWSPHSSINDMIAMYGRLHSPPPPNSALRHLPIKRATSSFTLPIESTASFTNTPNNSFPGFDPLALPRSPLPAAQLATENASLKARIVQADALLALDTIENVLPQPPIRRTRYSRTTENFVPYRKNSIALAASRLGRTMAGQSADVQARHPFHNHEMLRDLWGVC